MKITYRYRLYPTKAQATVLAATLETCRTLYNSLLHWRTHDYLCFGRSVTRFEQQAKLPVWKKAHPELKQVHSQALQDVVHRVDQAFQAFFRRAQTPGGAAGYPKRRGQGYDSFTYTQSGFGVADGKLRLSKIGSLKIRLHRPFIGAVKTCTIRRLGEKWFACIRHYRV